MLGKKTYGKRVVKVSVIDFGDWGCLERQTNPEKTVYSKFSKDGGLESVKVVYHNHF